MLLLQLNNKDVQSATQTLLEQGIIGALLFLAVAAIIALLWFGRKSINRQLLDKDREVMRLQNEINNMRESYRNNIEGAIKATEHAINSSTRSIDENNKFLSEIRHLLIKLLDSKL